MSELRPIWLSLSLIGLLLLGGTALAAGTADRIQGLLSAPTGANFDTRDLDLSALRDFYGSRSYRPAWTGDAISDRDADAALDALAHADNEGLDAAQYHVTEIGLRRRAMTVEGAAEFELLLTDGLLRYARDLHSGRAALRSLDEDVALPAQAFDASKALEDALSTGHLPQFLNALAPMHPAYGRLKRALTRYRQIADAGGWEPIQGLITDSLDTATAQTGLLRQRLSLENVSPTSDLKTALQDFQRHHGLEPDGRPGRKTMEALNVPASERVNAIEANMERWRWLPRDLGRRYIAVNAADATLAVVEDGRVVLSSKVIAGKPSSRTAIFSATITGVTFNPDWKIPASIAHHEILPKARRNPNYLSKNHIVADPSGALRQLPGPDNALGELKMEMPNGFDEYLHDTPARKLFGGAERHLSHGCIRVEQIKSLASFALTGDPARGLQDVQTAIDTGKNKRVSLENPLPVFVLYWTVIANTDGSVDFLPDVYGRDGRLLAKLEGKALAGRITLNNSSECSKA